MVSFGAVLIVISQLPSPAQSTMPQVSAIQPWASVAPWDAEKLTQVKPAPCITDSVPIVLADLQQNAGSAAVLRYLWYPLASDPAKARQQVDSIKLAVHQTMNHSSVEQGGDYIGNGTIRLNLFQLAGGDTDKLKLLIDTFDRFGGTTIGADDHEPFTLTNSQQAIIAPNVVQLKVIRPVTVWVVDQANKTARVSLTSGSEQVNLQSGQVITLRDPFDKWQNECTATFDGFLSIVPKSAVVVLTAKETRIPAPYLGEQLQAIIQATGARSPIVHAGEFIRRATTQVDGIGLWYKFRGITKSTDPNVTDFDFILKQVAGITQSDAVRLRGTQRGFINISKVTETERFILGFQGPQSRPGKNQAFIVVTGDFRKNRPNHELPSATLDEARPDAMEVFIELENGVILTLLFNGFDNDPNSPTFGKFLGELQDEAPPNIVSDHAAPRASDRRINGMLSCFRCHTVHHKQPGPWIEFGSDLSELVKSGKTNFTTIAGIQDPQRLDRLTGEILAQWRKPIQRANDDYSESLLALTGTPEILPEEISPQRHIAGLVEIYNDYVHEPVDARRALLYAGLDCPPESAVQVVSLLLPNIPGQVRYASALSAGQKITPDAFRAIAVDFIFQTRLNYQAFMESQVQPQAKEVE